MRVFSWKGGTVSWAVREKGMGRGVCFFCCFREACFCEEVGCFLLAEEGEGEGEVGVGA